MFDNSTLSPSATFLRPLLALLLLLSSISAAAQAPTWQSARAVALGNSSLNITASAVDAAGNVFLAGNFTNAVVLGGTTLTSLGAEDVFVAKFNPASNQIVWAQRAGGTDSDVASSLAVNGTSVYVTGNFSSSMASFGPATLTKSGLSYTTEVFVAKLTDAGNTGSFVWAQQAGGTESDDAFALAVNGSSIYVTGQFESFTAGFGPITLTTIGGSRDVFVAKLTDAGSTGSFVWVQRAGGIGTDYAYALAVSGTSVYVAGGFDSPTAGFGSTVLANGGSKDVFLAKLTDMGSAGNFVWAQRAGRTGYDYATALAANGTNVYVAGNFEGFGVEFGSSSLNSAGMQDIFVAKLTDAGSSGSFNWAQRAGGTGYDYAKAVTVSGTSMYVAGSFEGPSAGFGLTTLTNARPGYADVFMAKLTDAGSFSWAQRAGGSGYDAATSLAVSGTDVYVAGNYGQPTAIFGTTTLTNPSQNTSLGFLASITDPTLMATEAGRTLTYGHLFPNPARYTVTLRLPAGAASGSLTLTDTQGRAVRHYPAPTRSEAALDLRGLPAGLYLLRDAGQTQRLVVE